MNWVAISAICQVVGAIAVVTSLIYVAREVRSNARATREASMRSVSEAFARWVQQLLVHPELRELYYRGIHDFESLEGGDLVGFIVLMNEVFRHYQELYYQQLEGRLGPRLWRGFEKWMREANGYPGIQAWWRSRSEWFNDEFVNHINQLQQTAKPTRLYREPMEDQ